MDMTTALRMMAGRAPSVMHEALKALHAPEGTRQMRYNRVAQSALRDPEADWTPEERTALVNLIEPMEGDNRDTLLSVRLSSDERAMLEDAATLADLSLSEYARRRLLA